ncbi:hypothetical protein QVD17_30937 [Tagetes erecta]|uniref:Transposase n=1 Tax=Tagetes erecta TaxID=13708 RepID=A0AAD8K8U3_TARER|nr:hypothetical protein QVD17_30937 [Tagetes erecta]
MKYQSRPIVLDHLICSGFRRDYSKWVYHGEDTTSTSTSTTLNEEEDMLHHEMHDMLDDMFETEGGDGMDMHGNGTENNQESNNKRNGFDDLLQEVGEKSKFNILPNETKVIKQSILHSMGRKWKAWKGSLKASSYDPSLTVDEIVAQQVNSDKRVNPTKFKKLVTQWFTPEYQATENNGVYPTRGEVYIKTRTRKDGTIFDDKAAHVVGKKDL